MNPMIPSIPSLAKYSLKETRELLGVSRTTLQRWEERGIIRRSGVRQCNGRPYFYGKEILRVLKG